MDLVYKKKKIFVCGTLAQTMGENSLILSNIKYRFFFSNSANDTYQEIWVGEAIEFCSYYVPALFL